MERQDIGPHTQLGFIWYPTHNSGTKVMCALHSWGCHLSARNRPLMAPMTHAKAPGRGKGHTTRRACTVRPAGRAAPEATETALDGLVQAGLPSPQRSTVSGCRQVHSNLQRRNSMSGISGKEQGIQNTGCNASRRAGNGWTSLSYGVYIELRCVC